MEHQGVGNIANFDSTVSVHDPRYAIQRAGGQSRTVDNWAMQGPTNVTGASMYFLGRQPQSEVIVSGMGEYDGRFLAMSGIAAHPLGASIYFLGC